VCVRVYNFVDAVQFGCMCRLCCVCMVQKYLLYIIPYSHKLPPPPPHLPLHHYHKVTCSYALDSQLMDVVTGTTTTTDTKSHETQDTTSSSKVSEMMHHCVE